MTAADKVFAGSIPAIYEKLMVPMIFVPYAREIAGRIRRLDPMDVLEIATGTGVLTRAMVSALGPAVRIVASDLNQPMLDLAMEKMAMEKQAAAGGRITWKQADALALPFEDQSFDVVACQFGVMFFPDKIKGYREARRVLKPGGRYIFSVWDKVDNNEFASIVTQTVKDMFSANPPLFFERTPHGYYNFDIIEKELKTAGFSSVNFETVDHVSTAASPLDAATAYCQGNPLRGEIETRAPGALDSVTKKVAEALEKRFGHGRIQGRIRAFIVTAEI